MKLCNVCCMRNLASRFIRSNQEIIYVVDPYLDLRHCFKNLVDLEQNLKYRKLDINVFDVMTSYMKWWSSFRAFKDISKQDDIKLKQISRNILLNQSHGLLSALELPNSLDLNKIERCKPSDLFEVELNKIELDFSNYFLTLKAIENHFTKLTKLFHKSNVLYLATPYIVRPAIIEACNINLDTIPMISNDQNNGLCVPGVSLSSMITCFVQKRLGSTNPWPLTFFSYGKKYLTNKNFTNLSYSQCNVFSLMNFYRNEDERMSAQSLSLQLIDRMLTSFSIKYNDIIFEQVPISNLQLAESSAACWRYNLENECVNLARFSHFNDYISQRIHLKYSDSDNSFIGLNFIEIDLSNIMKCLKF